MSAESNASQLFLEFSRSKLLGQYWPRMRTCVESLTDEQVWWRPNPASNSVGNLLLHLNGNVRQWLVASFSHAEFKRNRPTEFHEELQVPRSVLLAQLDETLQQADAILARLTKAELLAEYEIQGYSAITGLAAVYQVVEHFGLHYGQVIYITKLLRGEDIGFYRELNQTGHNPGKR
jgi:hypothetical protein